MCVQPGARVQSLPGLSTIHIWAERRSWHASYDKLLLAQGTQSKSTTSNMSFTRRSAHARLGQDKTWTGY